MKAEKILKKLKKASGGEKVKLPSPRKVKDCFSDFLWLTTDEQKRDLFRDLLITGDFSFEENVNPQEIAEETFSDILLSIKTSYSFSVSVHDLAFSLNHALSFCYNDDQYNEFIKEFKNEYL